MMTLDNGGRASGAVSLVAPPADLADVVEHASIDYVRVRSEDWRVVPDASPYLIAIATAAGGVPRLSIVLVGARSRFAAIDSSHRSATIAVRLRPGALPLITGVSALAFVDRSVPIADVFAARALRDLELSADAPARLLAVQLLRLLRRVRRGTMPALLPSRAAGTLAVTAIASSLGMPSRSLHERYRRYVGLSPKRMLRITRLHEALRAARRGSSWSAVAQASGFADQSHLTREMQALLGETPGAWAARGAADSFKTRPPSGT
jgi:AraC-like DNA-binding protein